MTASSGVTLALWGDLKGTQHPLPLLDISLPGADGEDLSPSWPGRKGKGEESGVGHRQPGDGGQSTGAEAQREGGLSFISGKPQFPSPTALCGIVWDARLTGCTGSIKYLPDFLQ